MKELRLYQKQAVQGCWNALKENDDPVLLMASVGAGKSLMLADILLRMEKLEKRALCLVNNAELVRNNCATFIEQGGKASIYCAALGVKEFSENIIFGTPQSILNGINKNEAIGQIKFNLIVVDEAHTINYLSDRTVFMRILRHYKQTYPDMRLLGATGTNFRFRGTGIVGPTCLFRNQVGNITTEQLIEKGYLIEPTFEVDKHLILDFSKVKIKSNGQFCHKQLESVIDKSARLTALICAQVVHIMETQSRRGVFFFATTKKHAYEILSHLPPEQSAIILGETPHHERTEILNKARRGDIKYLVNIAIISVGVDVPAYDTIAYLRPTESLVLLVQTMGRALRLSPATGKTAALVLDFAGNIERHRDWDNPLLDKAVKTTLDRDRPRIIECPSCQEMNTEYARRCMGKVQDKRCDYYFEFKLCPNEECQVKNDISCRHCRACQAEIIDPNAKLTLEKITPQTKELSVLKAQLGVSGTEQSYRINCAYYCKDESGKFFAIKEHYSPSSEKAKRLFYGQFIKNHCKKPNRWFSGLQSRSKVIEMLTDSNMPSRLLIQEQKSGYKIKKKYFD